MAHTHDHLIEWRQFPFVRIAPALICGILGADLLSTSTAMMVMTIAALIALICFALPVRSHGFHLGLHLLTALSGMIIFVPGDVGQMDRSISWEGPATVCEIPEEKPKTYQTTLLIRGMNDNSGILKLLAYIKKSSTAAGLCPGDRIEITAEINPVQPPRLPGQFDYRSFLAGKNIHYSAYIRENDWKLLSGIDRKLLLKRKTSFVRKRIKGHFERFVPGRSGALLQAMFLGDRSGIDTSTRNSFAKAGIVHILAVSGLHVGIIYMIVSFLLKPLTSRGSVFRKMGVALEVLAIWAFAWMTGMGPAVQRAAFMFSLFSLARLMRMETNSVNIAAASAVVLIIFHPTILFNIGFQLSYSAVFGILLTYPVFAPILTFQNKLLKWIWQMEVVSFGAVAGTAPISIYYFQQFPLTFPVSNLIAIPTAFLMVSGAVLLIAVQFSPLLSSATGIVLEKSGDILVESTSRLAAWHYSHIAHLYISRSEVVLLYLLLAATLYSIASTSSAVRFRNYAQVLLLLIIFFQVRAGLLWMEYRQPEFYIEHQHSFHMNVGRKQYRFKMEDLQAQGYKSDLSGHWKYDRIYKVEEFHIRSDEMLDSLKQHFNQPGLSAL